MTELELWAQVVALAGAVLSAQWGVARMVLRALERVIQQQETTLQRHLEGLQRAVEANTRSLNAVQQATRDVSLALALRGQPEVEAADGETAAQGSARPRRRVVSA